MDLEASGNGSVIRFCGPLLDPRGRPYIADLVETLASINIDYDAWFQDWSLEVLDLQDGKEPRCMFIDSYNYYFASPAAICQSYFQKGCTFTDICAENPLFITQGPLRGKSRLSRIVSATLTFGYLTNKMQPVKQCIIIDFIAVDTVSVRLETAIDRYYIDTLSISPSDIDEVLVDARNSEILDTVLCDATICHDSVQLKLPSGLMFNMTHSFQSNLNSSLKNLAHQEERSGSVCTTITGVGVAGGCSVLLTLVTYGPTIVHPCSLQVEIYGGGMDALAQGDIWQSCCKSTVDMNARLLHVPANFPASTSLDVLVRSSWSLTVKMNTIAYIKAIRIALRKALVKTKNMSKWHHSKKTAAAIAEPLSRIFGASHPIIQQEALAILGDQHRGSDVEGITERLIQLGFRRSQLMKATNSDDEDAATVLVEDSPSADYIY